MMDDREFLERRKNKVIKDLLNFKDDVVDPYLPADISSELRGAILDGINDLCSIAVDLITPDINELFLEKLDNIEKRLMEQ